VFTNTSGQPPVFAYAGVPKRALLPDGSVFGINVGLFVSDNANDTTVGAAGFFTLAWGGNNPVVGFFSNRTSALFPTRVYIDNYDASQSADTTYSAYYSLNKAGNTTFDGGNSIFCSLNSTSGQDAYSVFTVTQAQVQ
jgi:hypothetical protein